MDTYNTSLDISGFQALVGKDLPQPTQFNYDVNRDAIRHFADAVPDENGLYYDPEYAATTRWRGIIAPPGYLYAHGSPAWLSKMPGIKDRDGRELEGGDNATEGWEFYKPVRPGDVILSYGKIHAATPKRSRKLGEAVLVNEQMRFTNQRGEVVALLNSFSFRFDQEVAKSGGQIASVYPPMPAGRWTRNEMTAPFLPGTFEVTPTRYDENRYFEDVTEGEELTPWEFGPLMVIHIGRFNAATIGTGTDRIGQIGHVPDAFAPGVMRIHWFGSMLSRWAGPDAWVTKIQQRNEEWVLVGYKLIFGGTVAKKSVVDGRCLVDVNIWCKSELGFQTNSGTAQIEMPSRVNPMKPR